MERPILKLGNPQLYRRSKEVSADELESLRGLMEDLHDTLLVFKRRNKRGRALTAPQIGVQKRIIYVYIDAPTIILNPIIHYPDKDTQEVLDECLSFPGLMVKVRRYRRCVLQYRNLEWMQREVLLEGELALLAQHNLDHLDGILATMRTVDNRSFFT